MKSIFKYTFVGLLSGTLLTTSCSEDQLNTSPTRYVSSDAMLSSATAAQTALNGVYREMFTSGWSTTTNTHQCFGIAAYNLMADIMGEDHVMGAMGSGWFWYDAIYNVKGRYTSSGWRSYDLWFAFYNWIANANYVIGAEETMGGGTAEKNYVIGQAYAIRAYSYFMLSQLFARTYVGHETEPCVPLYTEGTKTTTEGKPRSTVADVYKQIDSDLAKAVQLLEGTSQADVSHMGYAVALAIQARVAMVKNDWAGARDAAHKAITASKCSIISASDVEGMNDATKKDVMWGVTIINDQVGMYASLFSHMDYEAGKYGARAPKKINAELYAKMSATDARREWWRPGNDEQQPYLQEKFKFSNVSTWMGDYIFMRVEEMYLTAAEAECRLGDEVAAKKDLMALMSQRDPNYVVDKTGNALGATSAPEDETGSLLEEILIQRRIELWGEFGRMYDLKRLKQGFRRTEAQGWPSSARLATRPTNDPEAYMNVFTIPQAEFDGNVNMDADKDQNPIGDYKE